MGGRATGEARAGSHFPVAMYFIQTTALKSKWLALECGPHAHQQQRSPEAAASLAPGRSRPARTPPQRPCRFHPVRLDRDVLGGLADVERDLIRVAAPA